MADEQVLALESNFVLGDPALVCRWRLASAKLPLETRHLKALRERTVNGARVSTQLVAWAKQHIEWTLAQGSADHPDGVLMLIVDRDGRAAMTVGPYVALEDARTPALVLRARKAQREAELTGVAPETLWVAREGALSYEPGEGCADAGCASLVLQLAQTMGLSVERREGLLDEVSAGAHAGSEVFLVSDEHGVVPATDACDAHGSRMAQAYERLLASTRG